MSELWRRGHPRVAEVLTALDEHCADRQVTKGARKAAFEVRSRVN